MTGYEAQLLAKITPVFEVIRKEAAGKTPNDEQMAELFIIGFTALVGVVADIRRIAENAEVQHRIAAADRPYIANP